MICYPILIPTLCRFEHFKNCVESLAANSLASQTDLYIGLDYPLKEEHWQGYRLLCEYIPSIIGFKSVKIYKRKYNYGTSKNLMSLLKEAFKDFDAIIFSEDDNIFSPNFLEYVNKGLERFKSDSSVIAVCGYRHFYSIKFDRNNYFRQNVAFSAWGYGTWKNEIEVWPQTISKFYFRKKLMNPQAVYRVWKHGYSFLLNFIQYAYGNWDGIVIDSVLNVYMIIENKTVIMPTVSKVRNMGWDGSGEHCVDVETFAKQPIDTGSNFEYQGDGWEYFSDNEKIYAKENYAKIKLVKFLKIIMSRLFL